MIEAYFASLRDLSFEVKITIKNESQIFNECFRKCVMVNNNIGNRSLNFSLCFLEPMMINSVLLGFSFSFEFVIQVKTSVTQDFKSVRDSEASKPDRDI